MTKPPDSETRVAHMIEEGMRILSDPERLYDLCGKRFACIAAAISPSVDEDPFRIGIIGNPNRGKTTYGYSSYLALQAYQIPSAFVDMDIRSPSGDAIAGKIGWDERPKVGHTTQQAVDDSIERLRNESGIVIADFPGLVTDLYHDQRLAEIDMAMLLRINLQDQEDWLRLTSSAGVPTLWLKSRLEMREQDEQIDPAAVGLNRKARVGIDTLSSTGRILETAARMRDIDIPDYWPLFSEAERTVLEEVVDLEFAPIT